MSTPPSNPNLRSALRPPGPPRLELSRRERRDAIVVEVRGELDILTTPKLGMALDELIRSRPHDIVVDLRKTTFLDSSGLHILLNSLRRLTRGSRQMSVISRPGPVHHVIELARLVETLNVVGDLREYERRHARRGSR
jgi:anti-sigma B factor antagonist